jgi:DNA primase
LQGLYLIPIKNKGGAIVGFAGRIPPGSTGSKYINSVDSEYFHKGNILWNYNQHKTSTKMYVLEGYFDVLTAEMAGVPAVAVMSAGLTPKGAELLDGKEVILCLDNDATGQQSMENLILRYPRYQVLDMSTVPYKDWNDTLMSEGLDKVKDLFNTLPVLSGPEWLLNRRLKSIDLSSSLEKRKLFKEISALADKIGGLEGLHFQAIAWFKILGLDNPTEEAIRSFLNYKTKTK